MNKKHFVLGGDIKKSLTEGYHLDFKALFKDAWIITKKHYFPLITASLFTIIILAGCYHLLFEAAETLSETSKMIANYMITLLIAPPLLTGLQMMGIHHSIGLKTKSNHLFNHFNIILKLSLATMIISLITNVISVLFTQTMGDLGLLLSILVMLYLNIAFSLVYPLIAEKKLSAQMALRLSFRLVHKNLWQFTIMFILLAMLFVIALLPSGLGMFIFIPFYFNLMGIVYRQLCGVGVVATTISDDNDNDDDDSLSDEFEA